MAIAVNLYDTYRQSRFDGTNPVDWDADTIKAAVVDGTYTPDQNAHDFWNDASADEVSGTGYTAGGVTLVNATVTMDASGNITVDADDFTITQNAAGFANGRRLILYKDTGTASTSPLIAYSADFGADRGNVDGDLTFAFSASGIITSAR